MEFSKLDYLIKDSYCEQAIEDFKILTSVPSWLTENAALFDSISIKPDGLPPLTDAHFEGECFENILTFAHLYKTVDSLF
jgi:hypothetical protein